MDADSQESERNDTQCSAACGEHVFQHPPITATAFSTIAAFDCSRWSRFPPVRAHLRTQHIGGDQPHLPFELIGGRIAPRADSSCRVPGFQV